MDPANVREGLREVLGHRRRRDLVMVKPGLPYLDVLHRVKQASSVPVAAYQVSGEYAMIKAAAAQGWVDEEAAMLEPCSASSVQGPTSWPRISGWTSRLHHGQA